MLTLCDYNVQNFLLSCSVTVVLFATSYYISTFRLRQNGGHFPDNSFMRIFLNENFGILNEISLKGVPFGLTDNMATLGQIMAWRLSGDKPLSEPMSVCFFWSIYASLSLNELKLTTCTQLYVGPWPKWWWIYIIFIIVAWWGVFRNTYELLNQGAFKLSFQCCTNIIYFYVWVRVPLKFHTRYHTHTLKDVYFIQKWIFKSS